MTAYLIRRLLASILILLGVSMLIFAMIHLVPGDPVAIMLHEVKSGPGAIEEMRRNLGLDRPLPEQYLFWLIGNDYVRVDTDGDDIPDSHGTRQGVLRGDFGRSIFKRAQVIDIIADRFPATLKLTVAAMFLALPVGILAGIVAAIQRETLHDYVTMMGALLGVSIPPFWLGLMLMYVFGVELRWVRPFVGDRGWVTLILPTITLAAPTVAIIARLTRSSMLNVLGEDFVRTARAKGVREGRVLTAHVLRNAFIPVLTILGLQFGYLLGGAVIVETVFVFPGLGREVVTAIINRDFPLVQGVTLFSATLFVLINFGVDMLYTAVDPRIRYA